ncbi:MAG: hypothetical protein P4L81_06520 [Candidatus Pacebacteria bacterium]|nr:hypothetical protein [Candidatus Paceibacterota bacterium]
MINSSRNWLVWALLIVLVVALAFYFGLTTGQSTSTTSAAATSTQSTTTAASTLSTTTSAQTTTYTNPSAGYSITYPTAFAVTTSNSPAPSTDWRVNNVAQAPGIKTFTLTVPSSFEPQTNFVGATLTVGYSQSNLALADCLIAKNGEATSTTQSINNATFAVFTMRNPGAGQLYDTTSYRTTHAGACYAVEYTIHSAQLGNYPQSSGMQQFDETRVSALLAAIVGTFKFQ